MQRAAPNVTCVCGSLAQTDTNKSTNARMRELVRKKTHRLSAVLEGVFTAALYMGEMQHLGFSSVCVVEKAASVL